MTRPDALAVAIEQAKLLVDRFGLDAYAEAAAILDSMKAANDRAGVEAALDLLQAVMDLLEARSSGTRH